MGFHAYNKYYRPRQEISRILKYLIFAVNFLFWLCGVACLGMGVYLYASDFRPVLESMDFFLNPSILLILAGAIVFLVAFLGCAGALRENICMLRAFAFSIFFCYVALVVLAFIVFILFYSDSKTGVSMQTVLLAGVKKYHESKNTGELINAIQSQLTCCGVTSSGYKDWNENSLYNCSRENLAPEKCGVPHSCCKPPKKISVGEKPSGALSPEIGAPNVFCGFGAQEKAISEIQNTIYIDGCLHPLQKLFEGHAVVIGAVIGALMIPICISVTFTNILAKQIDHQRYLLAREARRDEKRRRRHRSKFRDPFQDPSGVMVRKIEILPQNPIIVPNQQNPANIFNEQVVLVRNFEIDGGSRYPPPLPPNHPAILSRNSRVNNIAVENNGMKLALPPRNSERLKNKDDLKFEVLANQEQKQQQQQVEQKQKGVDKSHKKVKARAMSTDSGCDAAKAVVKKSDHRKKSTQANRPSMKVEPTREEQVVTLAPVKNEQQENFDPKNNNTCTFDRRKSICDTLDKPENKSKTDAKKRRYSVAAF